MSGHGFKMLVAWVAIPCLLWGGIGYVAYRSAGAAAKEARIAAVEMKQKAKVARVVFRAIKIELRDELAEV